MTVLRIQWLRRSLHRLVSMSGLTLVLIIASPLSLYATDNTLPPTKAPGLLIKAGSHRLHLFCQGSGAPAVIMDSGLGGFSPEWYRLQEILGTETLTCSYDRAGYGWSETGPGPRTSSRLADELYLLLQNAGIPAPYVLMGHSFGGYTMQLFARRYPHLTAGLVLVESSHPEQVQRFLAPPIRLKTTPSIQGETVYVRFGMPRLHPGLPDDLKATIKAFMLSRRMREALAGEYLYFRSSADEVRKAGPFPDIPLIVLTRGLRLWPQTTRGDLIEHLWFDLQRELAAESRYSAHLLATQSGHFIHLDQPRLVADAVSLVVNIARQRNTALSAPTDFERPFEQPIRVFKNALWISDRLTVLQPAAPGVEPPHHASVEETP